MINLLNHLKSNFCFLILSLISPYFSEKQQIKKKTKRKILERFEPFVKDETKNMYQLHLAFLFGFMMLLVPFVAFYLKGMSILAIVIFSIILLCIIYHYLVFIGDMKTKIKKIIIFKLTQIKVSMDAEDYSFLFDNEISYEINDTYLINKNIYNTLNVGDFVAISMLPKNKTVFNIEKIENPSDNNPK